MRTHTIMLQSNAQAQAYYKGTREIDLDRSSIYHMYVLGVYVGIVYWSRTVMDWLWDCS